MSYEEKNENINSKISALRVSDNKRVWAEDVTKNDGPFYCDETLEELIVRKCFEKVDHFAYKSRRSPISTKESKLHKKCKKEIVEILQRTFPDGKWEEERKTFLEDKEKGYKRVVPDLSGKIDNKGVIIEIQKSTLSVNKILHRTEQYNKRGAYIIWIIPLTTELGDKNFRPRLFERFLHTMYYGRVYYWYENNGTKLIPVHFEKAERWIEESVWYNEYAEEQVTGGYFKPFLKVKKPLYGEPVDLTKRFKFEDREEFELENEKLSAPKSKIYMDRNKKWW
ncbi:competence protein CoiA [Wenyingzhuangia heitensis]|uniref:Competence protein CoiA n=1 Tax=Wenyingzhuangia heitensis TaxID=1487859 RepID=A0ABX0UFI9_9FLAO|nr:competence protein CoiA family protein [Wenyingzhuangia heitensis]NIJ46645.1 competence protein CoiA [Wenyingzhuangia heitensis]